MKKTLIILSLACTSAFAQEGAMQQMPNLEDMFFQQFDENQDGRVTREEFLKPTEAQFDHMDRDKNGYLDKAEVEAFNNEMKQRMDDMQRQMQQQEGMPRR